MRLKSKTTATLLIALFMISAFAVVIPIIAEPVEIILGVSEALAAHATTTKEEKVLGSGSWEAIPNTKLELYLPINVLGSFTISEIQGISYVSNVEYRINPAAPVDFTLNIYTEPYDGGDKDWYGNRLSTEPMYSYNHNPVSSEWNTWSTNMVGTGQLQFYDSGGEPPHSPAGFYTGPTLFDIKAGTITWDHYITGWDTDPIDYAGQTVKYIALTTSTGGNWEDFDGYLDNIRISLTGGRSAIFDLESTINTVESSTMHFGGSLEPYSGGVYKGIIPMTIGEYYVQGGLGEVISTAGGFDVYAKEVGNAYIEGMSPDTWIIGSDHDAYSEAGPWGTWYDPDCADWNQYSLELTEDHWYLRYTATGESPMSGVMIWRGDGTGYAAETDPGTVKATEGISDLNRDAKRYAAGSAQEWGWHCGWGEERIPLEYPGFEVTVTSGSPYHVTLTPADASEGDIGLDAQIKAEKTLTLQTDGEGLIEATPNPPYYLYHDETANEVSLTPVPDNDWMFDHWLFDGSPGGVDYPLEFTMHTDHTVKAFFTFVPVVSISVDPTSISFVGAIAGTEFDPEVTIIVTNIGNVDVLVTADIPGTEPGDVFFRSYLRLTGVDVDTWSPKEVLIGKTRGAPVTLDLSSVTEPGQYSSTLVFWAEKAP